MNQSIGSTPESYEPIFSQRVIKEEYISHTPARFSPSALKALTVLTGVEKSDQIGQNGPPNAAGATEQNKGLDAFDAYQEIYPRDAAKSSQILRFRHPELTKVTALTNLRYTGTIDSLANTEWIDEQEVGMIPHQVRDPEHPRSRRQYELRKRGYPFYGAVDTTQKNILLITDVCLDGALESLSFLNEQYTDIQGQTHSVLEGLNANADWVLRRTHSNPEGLIESIQTNPRHHANKSWADSPDSFHHADGSLARHHPDKNWGVASVEVNAETYDAMRAAIRTYEALREQAEGSQLENLDARIAELETQSAKLKQSIHEYFWVEDENHYGGYFARGTDRDESGNLHPLEIRSSDMGHLLLSEVLDDDDPKVLSIIQNLFSPEMLAANGIRTLSSDSIRYDKDAYHNGSVWPWDTYEIVLGLEKRGYFGLAEELESRIMRFHQETNTLAEYGSGDDEGSINMTRRVTIYDPNLHEEPIEQYSQYNIIQPPQEIQAWTVATVLAIKFKRTLRKRGIDPSRDRNIDPAIRKTDNTILASIR